VCFDVGGVLGKDPAGCGVVADAGEYLAGGGDAVYG
jgi:hypothetical protein